MGSGDDWLEPCSPRGRSNWSWSFLDIKASSMVRRVECEGDGPRVDVERPGLVSCGADNLTVVETGVKPRRNGVGK